VRFDGNGLRGTRVIASDHQWAETSTPQVRDGLNGGLSYWIAEGNETAEAEILHRIETQLVSFGIAFFCDREHAESV